jgi:hypothetical protein
MNDDERSAAEAERSLSWREEFEVLTSGRSTTSDPEHMLLIIIATGIRIREGGHTHRIDYAQTPVRW